MENGEIVHTDAEKSIYSILREERKRQESAEAARKQQHVMDNPILAHIHSKAFWKDFQTRSMTILGLFSFSYVFRASQKRLLDTLTSGRAELASQIAAGSILALNILAAIFLKKTRVMKSQANNFREYIAIGALLGVYVANSQKPGGQSSLLAFIVLCALSISGAWSFKKTSTQPLIKGYLVRKVLTIFMCVTLVAGLGFGYASAYITEGSPSCVFQCSLLLAGYTASSLVIQYDRFTRMEEIIAYDMLKMLLSTVFLLFWTFAGFMYRTTNTLAIEKILMGPIFMFSTCLSMIQLLIKSCEADIAYYSIQEHSRLRVMPTAHIYNTLFQIMVFFLAVGAILVFALDDRYKISLPTFFTLKESAKSLSLNK
ncbi:uncharacterized protein NEMAJ01_0073 [Nematocida major]|uniref:uncharacterized protein n=1 Tax=Nematocida major TaxID=1912982 RepID=UPI002007A801|nr:uncharacterized protein NEMAJ01_0073 [Nematocida major]KAH9385177.1 hypothetical protein NEMAJ01_0073 [Nematocida major]